MTVRQKIFAYMGLLVLIVSVSHAVTTQQFTNHSYEQFREEKMDAHYLNATEEQQIQMLQDYVTDKSGLIGIGKGAFFITVGLMFSFWISGVLTLPLKKLVAAIERVAQGDLDVKVPVHTNDEYGKLTRTFNEMTLRLRQAEDVRRRLVADVAHELRTPLSIMQLKLENFQQDGLDVSPEMLLQLHDEVIRLSLLVEDLHVLSLAEAGRLSFDRQPFDLAALLEQIVIDVQYEAEENGLAIDFTSEIRPVTVIADSRRMKQVFINLLTNAIRYTPAGGTISVGIRNQTVDSKKYACVSVTDTGIGIPADHLDRLFDRFYRVEEARSRHTGGMGLGLTIAQQFVKAHDGFIRVASQPDRGTTFSVYLPAGDM